MSNKVIKLLNKYTFNTDSQKKRLKGEARVIRNRMLLFTGILLTVCLILVSMGLYQKYENGILEDQIVKTEKVLDEKNRTYEDLEREIAQLNDDNYIRRIARSEFFMSESGEMVFSLPESDKKKEKDK
ncbi:FtsB family cell division protein [Phocicoccus pinnipedialis]|uniref:Cell division protein FtsL n=1 Tax=Phocicoccus pinnipedialis TaxID=110845 RepID=A0A6V7R4N1_9BACL|nr:septum formation initiator family protein [Jeotgalicoccus pinnipedialis]MBP1940094.1 cell division protein DivIC [Jeotgalicoccus pinnipedialis]CAD2071958.1 Cell division protein FtsL [Jeotgalicoccus pinnipedialis]